MTESEKLIRNEAEAIECLKINKPTSGYMMLQEAVDMAIQALEKQIHTKPIVDNWVSCDERLPDDVNKDYLVTYRDVILGNFEYGVCISYLSNFSDGNKSWEIEEEHGNNVVVTAWMNLPDAYLPNNKELKGGGSSE